jgi:sec-independent protein translocase protein TatC
MSNGKTSGEPSTEATETLLSHLIELRDRILRMFLAILVVFLMLFPFANQIYTFLATPLMVHLPEGTSMIAIEVAAPFLIPFKLVLLLAVVLTIPYTLYQLWAFIAPGLYKHEKKLAGPLVASSTILFYLGMAFAYFVVFPLIFAFFTATAPEGVAVMTDISRYLDFVIMLFIAFGIAFEVPIATILLVSMGATTPEKLASKRPYVIVGTFVIGMILTPPDIISQTLLALPMWILFEIGLILSRIMEKRKAERGVAEGLDGDPTVTTLTTRAGADRGPAPGVAARVRADRPRGPAPAARPRDPRPAAPRPPPGQLRQPPADPRRPAPRPANSAPSARTKWTPNSTGSKRKNGSSPKSARSGRKARATSPPTPTRPAQSPPSRPRRAEHAKRAHHLWSAGARSRDQAPKHPKHPKSRGKPPHSTGACRGQREGLRPPRPRAPPAPPTPGRSPCRLRRRRRVPPDRESESQVRREASRRTPARNRSG